MWSSFNHCGVRKLRDEISDHGDSDVTVWIILPRWRVTRDHRKHRGHNSLDVGTRIFPTLCVQWIGKNLMERRQFWQLAVLTTVKSDDSHCFFHYLNTLLPDVIQTGWSSPLDSDLETRLHLYYWFYLLIPEVLCDHHILQRTTDQHRPLSGPLTQTWWSLAEAQFGWWLSRLVFCLLLTDDLSSCRFHSQFFSSFFPLPSLNPILYYPFGSLTYFLYHIMSILLFVLFFHSVFSSILFHLFWFIFFFQLSHILLSILSISFLLLLNNLPFSTL